MQTEINFSLAHPDKRIMVGEFGALRWADGADRWLNDCIELFEEYGWDWCNHSPSGWNGYNVTYSPDRENWPATAPDGGLRGVAWRVLHEGFQLNGRDEYGIPNGWKARHFGAATAAKAGALDDWDADGMNNLDEYRAGTFPTSAASRFQIVDFSNSERRQPQPPVDQRGRKTIHHPGIGQSGGGICRFRSRADHRDPTAQYPRDPSRPRSKPLLSRRSGTVSRFFWAGSDARAVQAFCWLERRSWEKHGTRLEPLLCVGRHGTRPSNL